MTSKTRGNWSSWYEYLFSSIGCLVGLGNIWRFPYVCYKNGGGAFLIPYFLFLVVCAVPMLFAELSYSQYSNLGPGRVWIICPLFKGVGFAMVALTAFVSLYYNVIIAWAMFYLGNSFSKKLPWSACGHQWNTESCVLRGHVGSSAANNITNVTVFEYLNVTIPEINNTRLDNELTQKLPTEEFWNWRVLQLTSGIEEPGRMNWELCLCLFCSWLAVFLCLVKGIKTSGKVMYVAATLPYVFLTVLFVRGLLLPGAWQGVKYYLVPRWEDLLKISVWGDAAVQMFYSAGLGWGGLATLASYNNFHNNIYRDAMIIPFIDAVTSWFAGMVIFATLGYMANISNLKIEHVISEGPGIAFMVYPEALATLPIPQLWSVLFFVMLITVGLDSQLVHVQTLTSALMDRFPSLLMRRKWQSTALVCVVGFLLGLPCVTQGGIYVLTLIDWYCASVSVMAIALVELLALSWIYGTDRLYLDIEMMIGHAPNRIWKYCWKFITPLVIAFVWVFSIAKMEPVEYDERSYPSWSIGVGWIIGLIPILLIPVCMVFELKKHNGSLKERLLESLKPDSSWGPAIDQQSWDKNDCSTEKMLTSSI